MAEIQKDRIKIAPNNSKKTIAFITKCHVTDNVISVTEMVCARKVLMKKQVRYLSCFVLIVLV